MEIRFAIIPPGPISAMTATWAKKYARRAKHRFLVDNKKLFPHNTLFKVNVSKKNYLSLLSVCKKELRSFRSFNLEIKGFLVKKRNGNFAFKIKSSDKLNKLRKNLFGAIKNSKLVTKAYLKRTYHPHITLTTFFKKDPSAVVIKGELAPSAKFTVRDIGLCLSRQTQVYKILNTVKLK